MTTMPPAERLNDWGRTKAILGAITTVLVVAGVLWLAYSLRTVALLIFLSILFAYLLAPMVTLLESPYRWRGKPRGLSRPAAIATVYTVGIVMIGTAIYLIVPRIAHQLGALDQQMPSYMAGQKDLSQTLLEKYRAYRLPPAVREALDQAGSQAIDGLHAAIREALLSTAGLLKFIPWLILIPVIAVFLLKDAGSFRTSALKFLPVGRVRWRGGEFFEDVNHTIAFFVRAQLLACLFVGVIYTIGFLIIGVPYALLLGVVGGLFELVPLVGPLTTGIAAGMLAGAHSPQMAVTTVVFLVALRAVHDNVVYPRLIASGIKLHPLLVILALLCGGQLGGMIGLFLAIPLTAFLSVCYRHLTKQWAGNGLFTEILQAREPEPAEVPPVQITPTPSQAPKLERPDLTGVRVLVVDDDEDGRALLTSVLETEGVKVSAARSVHLALQLLGEQRFDVLLSDIGMPGEDGFEFIRQVRASDPSRGGDTPAAALTGYISDEDRERARAAGFQQHLGKPIDANELLRTVAALAGRV